MAEMTEKPLILKRFGYVCHFKDVPEIKKGRRADRSVRWMSNSRGEPTDFLSRKRFCILK